MHSRTIVLLPEPLTPVTETNRPIGIATEIFLRLFLHKFLKISEGVLFLTFPLTKGRLVGRDLLNKR